MTYHDPIQGILTCRPKTVLRRTATSVRLSGGNPRRNDRLQGILFKTTVHGRPGPLVRSTQALPEFTPGTIIPPLARQTAPTVPAPVQKAAAIDDLTLDEFDEVYLHSFLQARQTATVMKGNRRSIIHSVRLPLRRDK